MTYLEALIMATVVVAGISAMAALIATWIVNSMNLNHHPAITAAPVFFVVVILYSLAFYQ